MSNVQKLLLCPTHVSAVEEQDSQDLLQFTSQILRLQYLQCLLKDSPSFLEGHLSQILRCLKTLLGQPLNNQLPVYRI